MAVNDRTHSNIFVILNGFYKNSISAKICSLLSSVSHKLIYDSMSDLGEIRVYQRADFQSGSRVLKKVF